MVKGWHIFLVTGISALLFLFYLGLWGDPKAIPTVLIGTPAPHFSAPDLATGRTVSSAEFQGKVVVLNFWASWCQECRLEHQNLLAIQREFGDDPNFVMLGIDYQDKEADAKQYLEVFGSNFNHLRDPNGVISIDYGVYGVPETFVFDQSGIIRHKVVGPIVGANHTHLVDRVIRPLLRGERS
jgi:cytochrome c biogenesis protein CcmG/thiol:disulfide interchange protein DsbE